MAETTEELHTQFLIYEIKETAKKDEKRIRALFKRLGVLSPVEGMTLCFLILRTIGDEIRELGGGNSAELSFMEILKQTTGKRDHDSNIIFQSTDPIPAGVDKIKKASV